jgi:hypothetical protein
MKRDASCFFVCPAKRHAHILLPPVWSDSETVPSRLRGPPDPTDEHPGQGRECHGILPPPRPATLDQLIDCPSNGTILAQKTASDGSVLAIEEAICPKSPCDDQSGDTHSSESDLDISPPISRTGRANRREGPLARGATGTL